MIPPIKLTLQLLLLFGLFYSELCAQVYPGARRVSCRQENISLENLFRVVNEQTGMTAFYNDEQLNSYERVSVNFQNEPLDNVLARLLRKRGIGWCYRKDVFVVSFKQDNDIDLGYIPGEDKRLITGIVVGEKGAPLEAVMVVTGDKAKGMSTGKDGRFWLRDVEPAAQLLIQRMGYKPMMLSSYADSIYIQMVPMVAPLQEVSVTGAATPTLTGSVSQVKSKEIAESPVNNVLGALQGRVPGLYINQTTGLPGGGYRIRLRGRTSIESNSDPLILVDGIPFPAVSFNESFFNQSTTTGTNVAASPLNLLSVGDIASIQILKDADATALYGTKGANGVILINSKQPDERSKALAVSVNYYTGIGKASNLVRYLDTRQYLQMRKEAIRNDQRDADSTRDYDLLVWDTARYKDWQKEMIGATAGITDGSLELKGGSRNFAYRASGSYRQESTVYPSRSFRYNKTGAMLQLWFSSRDRRFTANLSGSFVADRNRLPITDITIYSAVTPPNAPDIYTSDNKLNFAGGTFLNPYAYMLQVTNAASRSFRPGLNLAWVPVSNLAFTANIGGSSITKDETQRSPAMSFNPASGVDYGIAQFFNNGYKNGLMDLRVNWKKTVGKEQFSLTAGSRFQFEEQLKKAYFAWGYRGDDLQLIDTTTAENVMKLDSSRTDAHYQSFYGRLEYKHADRYILTITGNRDGSTRLGRRYGIFGTVGAAWVFTRERWFRPAKFLSYGKLRASYGTTGNDQYERDLDLNAYVPGPVFAERGIQSEKPYYNPSFTWEKIRKSEVAIDFGLMGDLLSATFCYYNNRSTNLLLAGRFQTFVDNAPAEKFLPVNVPAIVANKGFEIDLEGVLLRSGSVTWTTNFNLSFPRNRLVYFPYFEQSRYKLYYSEGMSLDMIKGYHLTGVDPRTGLYRFEDIGQNGLSFAEDAKFGKEKGPFVYGGWYNHLRYKQFEISCLLRYSMQNNDGYQYSKSYIIPPGGVSNQPVAVLDRWQKPGDVVAQQRYTTDYTTTAGNAFLYALGSDQQLTDANYLRLQSLVIAYYLPEKMLSRIKIKSCKLYLQGINLFTISKYEGRDPEVTAGPDSYPSLRVITAGVQLSL